MSWKLDSVVFGQRAVNRSQQLCPLPPEEAMMTIHEAKEKCAEMRESQGRAVCRSTEIDGAVSSSQPSTRHALPQEDLQRFLLHRRRLRPQVGCAVKLQVLANVEPCRIAFEDLLQRQVAVLVCSSALLLPCSACTLMHASELDRSRLFVVFAQVRR